MVNRRRLRQVVLGAAVAIAASGLVGVAPTAAQADPSCITSFTGTLDVSGSSPTVATHVTSNPCGYPMRAYIHCGAFIGPSYYRYGNQLTGTGYSYASCNSGDDAMTDWGSEKYYNSQWVKYIHD